MNKLVSIQHQITTSGNIIIVNWCLGNTCNYNCSYCPDTLHSGSIKWIEYELAFNFCNKLIQHYQSINQKIEFLFTGGEPTLYASFPKLLQQLKKNNCIISVISNGSRTLNWWAKNILLFDKVILTYHSEFANKKHFSTIVEFLRDKVDLHINFTMLPNDFENSFNTANIIHSENSDVSVTLKPLLKDFGDKMYDYEIEQLNTLKTYKFNSSKNRISSRGLMKKVFDNGQELKCKAVDLIIQNENHWKGWKCNAGLELIYIDYKGDVYRGTCKQGGKITNIHLGENFEFPNEQVICGKETCHCITDIMTTKEM